MKYVKESPRLTVKFIDADTEETLFEIKDRNWMNVGEIFATANTNNIMLGEYKNSKLPKHIMVIVAAEFTLNDN